MRISAASLITPVFLVLAACSVPDTPTDIHDPYEQVNRTTHDFNKGIDSLALKPASQVYGSLVPSPVRTGVDNVASNLGMPSAILNKALQGEGADMFHNTTRFLVNTTFGLLGLVDVATDMGLEERGTDFGETLATWGTPEGAYLELPLFGPSTERDAAGSVVDIVTNPLGLIAGSADVATANSASSAGALVNQRYTLTTVIDGILYESADSYAQLRLFYLDNRRFNQGDGETESIDTEFYDDIYGDLFEE